MKAIRILIADDHEIFRQGVRALLAPEPEFELCGEAVNGREAVTMARELEPDVVILDISMPELNGMDAAIQIRRNSPQTQILILSMHETEQLVHGVLRAGARGYLLKSSAARHLMPAVRALAEKRTFFGSAVSQIVHESYLAGDLPPFGAQGSLRLTPREQEIVQLLCEGKSNKDVSTKLGITVKTAETHRAAIMRKLELDSFSELVRYAIRHHIIEA